MDSPTLSEAGGSVTGVKALGSTLILVDRHRSQDELGPHLVPSPRPTCARTWGLAQEGESCRPRATTGSHPVWYFRELCLPGLPA